MTTTQENQHDDAKTPSLEASCEYLRGDPRLKTMILMLQHFRSLSSTLHNQTARVLLIIAMHPGITVNELMKKAKLSQASCSRNISLLSHTDRHGKPGFGLVVAQPDPAEPRRHVMQLTSKGEAFIDKFRNIMNPQT